MNATTVSQLETRLQRVEWQNRLLIILLCVTAGITLLGAAKDGPKVLSVDELRAQRITLTDQNGQVVHRWWGTPGMMNE